MKGIRQDPYSTFLKEKANTRQHDYKVKVKAKAKAKVDVLLLLKQKQLLQATKT